MTKDYDELELSDTGKLLLIEAKRFMESISPRSKYGSYDKSCPSMDNDLFDKAECWGKEGLIVPQRVKTIIT